MSDGELLLLYDVLFTGNRPDWVWRMFQKTAASLVHVEYFD